VYSDMKQMTDRPGTASKSCACMQVTTCSLSTSICTGSDMVMDDSTPSARLNTSTGTQQHSETETTLERTGNRFHYVHYVQFPIASDGEIGGAHMFTAAASV
jgi:hypothetical protein